MLDLSKLPSRVKRQRAMELLSITDDEVFRKVVDANPRLVHKLAGEKRAKYLTAVIAELLSTAHPAPLHSRCATRGEGKTS